MTTCTYPVVIIPKNGCDCMPGYARDYLAGKCISINDENCRCKMRSSVRAQLEAQSSILQLLSNLLISSNVKTSTQYSTKSSTVTLPGKT